MTIELEAPGGDADKKSARMMGDEKRWSDGILERALVFAKRTEYVYRKNDIE